MQQYLTDTIIKVNRMRTVIIAPGYSCHLFLYFSIAFMVALSFQFISDNCN